MLHHLSAGTPEPGPDVNAVQLFFEVPAPVGIGPIDLILDLTTGDGIDTGCCPAGEDSFDSAVLHVPEPGLQSALLPGLCALAFATRRRRTKPESHKAAI
jgi:hypothetical protein